MRLSAALFLVVFFISAVVQGGAKEHFINGREYYEEGRYQSAIEEFEKAYEFDPIPAFLYNIAQCYEKLGKLRPAVEYLNRFLDEDKEQTDTESIKRKIANLEERIKKTGITVTATEEGAVIYVDDEQVGITPIENVVPLAEGMHAIRITKPGFEPFTMNVGVSTGYSVPVFAKLERTPPPPTVQPKPETPPPGPTPAPSSASKPIEPAAAPDEDAVIPAGETGKTEPLDIIPWVVAGTGAAIAVGGFAGAGTVAMVNNDDKLAVVADAVGWPGVAIAVGGTIWGVVRLVQKRKKARSSVALAVPIIDSSSVGVSAALSF
jgi:hypothetical protein